jgi:hypothetical protein
MPVEALMRIERGHTSMPRLRRLPLPPLLATLLLSLLMAAPASSQALSVQVKLTIERIQGHDFGEDPDFYAYVDIDGHVRNNEDTEESDPFEDDYTIEPNWEFSALVPVSKASAHIYLEIRDEDGGLRLDDDQADLDPKPNDASIDIDVQLATCLVTGDNTGPCIDSFTSEGTGDERANIRYRVEVSEPASAPGQHIRCTHTPLWPQPGETVTIRAEALDGALQPKTLNDTVEIWLNDRNAPAATAISDTVTHAFTAQENFSYGCRAVDGGSPIFTGWRITQVGMPADGIAVPVVYTGPRASSIDLVFIGDEDHYPGGANHDGLQMDVATVIADAYYDFDVFLDHQDQMNFWVAFATGDAEDSADGCDHEAPGVSWADTGVLLHRNGAGFRNCAPGGEDLFSASPTGISTVRHETGHRPFGLADEYCPNRIDGKCDGGYFEADPYPNVYAEPEECVADAPNLGRTAADCREWTEDVENWADSDWSKSDPGGDDLMEYNGAAQGADRRRINWLFDECRGARC